jgi:hypothetical protein
MIPRFLPLLVVPAFLACGPGGDAARVQVERDTVGDTLVVRTLEGSQWGAGGAVLERELSIGVFEGEDHYMLGQVRSLAVADDGSIYVMDQQVPALRKYAPDGAYVATFGREGGGPGEYKGPDGGLVALGDGRVVLRDPGNARLQVYSANGEPLATWPVRGGFNTGSPMVVDTAGILRTQVLLDPEAGVMEWRMGMAGIDTRTGQAVDTIPAPVWDYEAPNIVATVSSGDNRSTSVNSVPFSPQPSWAFSPLGWMVGGLSTRYAIDQYLPDGKVLRIERVAEAVPVEPDERADAEEQATWGMKRTQPDWKWNGEPIPSRKPAFRQVMTGLDGRLWVLVHGPAERIPAEELDRSDDPNARPPSRWREPVVFDVFEPDGAYLGRVTAPTGFAIYPRPVFRGDQVWAIVRDELDVQYIQRFRIAPPTEVAG